MKQLNIQLHSGAKRGSLTLELSSFNQLRWAVFALRQNTLLRERICQAGQAHRTITDSLSLMKMSDLSAEALPTGAFVILWDGINSFVELQERFHKLALRDDLVFLYVGHFWEAKTALPESAMALYDDGQGGGAFQGTPAQIKVRVPFWFDALCATRASLRFAKNRLAADARHKQLSGGGWVVFCGVVRFNDKVIDSFFRGANLPLLRAAIEQAHGKTALSDLEGMQAQLAKVLDELHAAQPQTPGDWACLYTVLNVMHRMMTLAMVRQATDQLFVNEYGFDAHFDPYDTPAYRRNVFVDFGSMRGCDLVYPRTVDLALQRKAVVSLRLAKDNTPLSLQLRQLDLSAFLQTCRDHANQVMRQLQHLPA